MKEYDEDKVIALMSEALGPNAPAEDEIYQVLDLIFDYYDENGELDIDAECDDKTDIEEMVDFIVKYLRGNSQSSLSREQIKTLVLTEIAYEDSLF